MIPRLLLAFGLCLSLSGCLVFIHATQGRVIDPEAVGSLEKGKTTLPEVLGRLGAPHEVHQHADGKVLIYRRRARNTFRLGIDPSQLISTLDATQLLAEAASNVSFTLERTHAGEDRLVILFDRDEVLRGVGLVDRTGNLPIF